MQNKVYKSKISYGVLVTIFLLFFGIFIYQFFNNNATTSSLVIVSIIHSVTLLFLVYMFVSIKYIIQNKVLKIKCSVFFDKTIAIDSITKIEKTNSLLSSPAASITDRIELSYNKFDTIIISPKCKSDFIKNVLEVNPRILVDAKLK
ncbi:PH domain-containing protein [Hyunsoonleella sp. 2307UL5-6]|uniref:PH domain-containing protein n=1 Tax=Hyunsoonleella sp. 2307UL5-6 TaxID=3384768 RepID=UPI0039BD87C4